MRKAKLAEDTPIYKKPKKKAVPKKSKMQDEIRASAPLLRGTVLVIDPSSGSAESLPGFCLVQQGVVVQTGVLNISRTKRAPERLRELALTLAESFPPLDVLCVEYIPPFMAKVGQDGRPVGGFRTQGVVNLHRAVGVVMACTQWKTMLQISPQSWHAWERRVLGEGNYDKNDENDAICMTLCLFEIAGVELHNRAELLPLLLQTK
jgi:hypothetical protein